MMFARVDCPESLPPDELDTYLEKGWFRMGQTIFTTNFLRFEDQYYGAVWLRVVLSGFSFDRTYRKLIRLNAAFRIEIQAASIGPEKEALFKKYRERVSFQASSSLIQLMFGRTDQNIYHTQEINIYDADKLIATGFFDIGEKSAAGITCFYDPAYKKYSLGKYLIYLKMEYCKERALQYFYPGYFVPGYTFFDYKLLIGGPSLQFLELRTKQWLPIEKFSAELSPFKMMENKLLTLQSLLRQSKTEARMLKYEFFDANLIPELKGAELFDFPLFLFFSEPQGDDFIQVIVYSVFDHSYHLIMCRSVWETGSPNDQAEMYSLHILKQMQDQCIAQDPDETATWILSKKV